MKKHCESKSLRFFCVEFWCAIYFLSFSPHHQQRHQHEVLLKPKFMSLNNVRETATLLQSLVVCMWIFGLFSPPENVWLVTRALLRLRFVMELIFMQFGICRRMEKVSFGNKVSREFWEIHKHNLHPQHDLSAAWSISIGCRSSNNDKFRNFIETISRKHTRALSESFVDDSSTISIEWKFEKIHLKLLISLDWQFKFDWAWKVQVKVIEIC